MDHHLAYPVELRWRVPQEFADLLSSHPYRLHLSRRGTSAVSVDLEVLPPGTIALVPFECPLRDACPLRR